MHILGLACGSPNGNSEILLKAALKAAQEKVSGTTVSFIRVPDLSIPSFPMSTTFDPSLGKAIPTSLRGPLQGPQSDDRPRVLNRILESDALIIASPIYTRQPPGILKYFCDKTLGPFVDAAHIRHSIKKKAAGDPRFANLAPDERVLKPRAAGFIAVGGAFSPEWVTFGLPLLHQCVFSLHAKVIDQMQAIGQPLPGSVLLGGDTGMVGRAKKLGENIATQLGLTYDEAQYLGEEGACPYCHLNMVVLNRTTDYAAECAVCGAKGQLTVGADGKLALAVDYTEITSIVTMEGKQGHLSEINDEDGTIRNKLRDIQRERDWYDQLGKDMMES